MNAALELDGLRLASLKQMQNKHMFTSILEPLTLHLNFTQKNQGEMTVDASAARVDMNVSYKDLDIITDVLAALSPVKEAEAEEAPQDPTLSIVGRPMTGNEWYLKASMENDAMSMLSLTADRGQSGRFSPSATMRASVREMKEVLSTSLHDRSCPVELPGRLARAQHSATRNSKHRHQVGRRCGRPCSAAAARLFDFVRQRSQHRINNRAA